MRGHCSAKVYWSDRRRSWVASIHGGAWIQDYLYPTWEQAYSCAYFQVSMARYA